VVVRGAARRAPRPAPPRDVPAPGAGARHLAAGGRRRAGRRRGRQRDGRRPAALPARAPGNPLEAYSRLPGSGPALLAVAALVAPLYEEFFFRGWLQGALERVARAWPALLATAAVFALVHGERFGLLPRFALAVGAGYAAWRTRSVWPAVALHSAYNASLFAGGAVLTRLLPAPPPMEAWADRDAATAFYWAHDPRVFGGAVVVLLAGTAAAAWALSRLPAAPPDPEPAPHAQAGAPAAAEPDAAPAER
jgi:hypothetical protein